MTIPEKGFYYHYKHDPSGTFNNYTYEVIGIARHSEDNSQSVVYRPLYETASLASADFWNRPLEMFIEDVEQNGKKIPRFSRITDPVLISKLEAIRSQIYQ